jgi:hypothetical protein
MKRREFLAASAATALGLVAAEGRAAENRAPKQIIELRTYTFASPEKLAGFADFLASAYIPALNRIGIKPVGAFTIADNDKKANLDAEKTLFLIIPHRSAESVMTLETRLGADEQLKKQGKSVLETSQKDPAYARYETQLLLSFDECPQLEVPTTSPDRVAQLRIYESHTNERALKKIAMFNEGGEIGIFRKTGLNPVFFGQSLAGTRMPNLTYMVAFENRETMKKGWGAFGSHPDWKKLSKDEAYKDTVSNIINLVLRPTKGSQI